MKSRGAMICDLAGAHVRLVDDAAHAAPVVAVRVRVDHRRDRQALADVLLEQLHRGARRFRGGQRVDDDPAGLAAHERDVGEVEAADLVDAGDHLVQPVVHVERGDAVERRVDRVEPLLLQQELVALHVPRDMAGVGLDLELRHRRDEAALLLVEVARVAERQRGARAFEHVQRELRRRLALQVEVAGGRRCPCAFAAPPTRASGTASARAAASDCVTGRVAFIVDSLCERSFGACGAGMMRNS